jgi:hypothetical protein
MLNAQYSYLVVCSRHSQYRFISVVPLDGCHRCCVISEMGNWAISTKLRDNKVINYYKAHCHIFLRETYCFKFLKSQTLNDPSSEPDASKYATFLDFELIRLLKIWTNRQLDTPIPRNHIHIIFMSYYINHRSCFSPSIPDSHCAIR